MVGGWILSNIRSLSHVGVKLLECTIYWPLKGWGSHFHLALKYINNRIAEKYADADPEAVEQK